jgi:hypothetical protein
VQRSSNAHAAVPLPVQNSTGIVNNCTIFAAGGKSKNPFPPIHSPNSNRLYLKK